MSLERRKTRDRLYDLYPYEKATPFSPPLPYQEQTSFILPSPYLNTTSQEFIRTFFNVLKDLNYEGNKDEFLINLLLMFNIVKDYLTLDDENTNDFIIDNNDESIFEEGGD